MRLSFINFIKTKSSEWLVVFVVVTLGGASFNVLQAQQVTLLDQLLRADEAALRVGPPGSPAFLAARAPALKRVFGQASSGARELPPELQGPPSLDGDSRFRANIVAMIKQSTSLAPRIWGGSAVASKQLEDVVALLGSGVCSGTLIRPGVILTAGHCYCDQSVARAFFGTDAKQNTATNTIEIEHGISKTPCSQIAGSEYVDPGNDFALLWLRKTSSIAPRKIADAGAALHVTDVHAAGFGLTDTGSYGVKMQADVPIASPNCTGRVGSYTDSEYWGCAAGAELVAARLNASARQTDTCKGDSGGPIFVRSPSGEYLLVGVTSRGIRNHNGCGDGGVYGLLNKAAIDWINHTLDVASKT